MSEFIDFFFDRIPPLFVFETSENVVSWAGQRYLRDPVVFTYGKLRLQLWPTDAVSGALDISGLSPSVKSQVRHCLSLEGSLVADWRSVAWRPDASVSIEFDAIAEILESVKVWGVAVTTNSGPIRILDLESVEVAAKISEFFLSEERYGHEGTAYFSKKNCAAPSSQRN